MLSGEPLLFKTLRYRHLKFFVFPKPSPDEILNLVSFMKSESIKVIFRGTAMFNAEPFLVSKVDVVNVHLNAVGIFTKELSYNWQSVMKEVPASRPMRLAFIGDDVAGYLIGAILLCQNIRPRKAFMLLKKAHIEGLSQIQLRHLRGRFKLSYEDPTWDISVPYSIWMSLNTSNQAYESIIFG